MTARTSLISLVLAAAALGPATTFADAPALAPVKGYVHLDEPLKVAVPAGAAVKLYTFDGQPLEAKNAPTPDDSGDVDLTASYPQIRDGGTFILTAGDAQPLVIETLYNPGRSKADLDKAKAELTGLPADQQSQILMQFQPTMIHVEPLSAAEIHTDKGDMKATFWYDVAPHTVDNFISLARQNFYDGSAFHRIIKGFMIQGGDSTGNDPKRAGTGGPGYEIMAEFNDKPHERGVLSMARSSKPDSAGSQFFVVHQKAASLDHQYTGFGQLISGLVTLDKIVETPVSDDNGTVSGPKPQILSVKIVPATAAQYGIKG